MLSIDKEWHLKKKNKTQRISSSPIVVFRTSLSNLSIVFATIKTLFELCWYWNRNRTERNRVHQKWSSYYGEEERACVKLVLGRFCFWFPEKQTWTASLCRNHLFDLVFGIWDFCHNLTVENGKQMDPRRSILQAFQWNTQQEVDGCTQYLFIAKYRHSHSQHVHVTFLHSILSANQQIDSVAINLFNKEYLIIVWSTT